MLSPHSSNRMTCRMDQSLIFDPELIRRYDSKGPRYTSYPTALQFHEGFSEKAYLEQVRRSNEDLIPKPLSLYFHLPFCNTVCFYCACNKVVTRQRERAIPYLQHLHQELRLQGQHFDRDRKVDQLHWGGGTPTFINHQQMRELMAVTADNFSLRDDPEREYSIEIDPRETREDTMRVLRECGFNRISLGVQDFNPVVQQAVNRIQSVAQTRAVIEAARAEGFDSISVDLIYGLPHQDRASFDDTLETVVTLSPDRIAVYNYAHLPQMFKPQTRIKEADLPTAAEKLNILQSCIELLDRAGYVYIGMDHFAKPDNELAIAQREGRLYRNFQGYSTHAGCDIVGMGITAIGRVADSYSQNLKGLETYYAAIDEGHIPVFRGVQLDADDLLRRQVISSLICNFSLVFKELEEQYAIVFRSYFAPELAALEQMQDDGLLRLDADGITVLPAGRLLIRNVCMTFDRYLHASSETRYSRTV